VDNAALRARLGDKLNGWDGVVNPFALSLRAGSSDWQRVNSTWLGRARAANGDELNEYVLNLVLNTGDVAAFALTTNVGTLWLQRSGENWKCCSTSVSDQYY
jgi:hypothetical protein